MPAFFNLTDMALDALKKLIDDLGAFDTQKEVVDIIEANTDLIVEMQSDQWMEGRGVDGEFLRPFYSENPYFKSKESAARYAKWKQKITPNPQRPDDVPNLYINGYLHSLLYADVYGEGSLDAMLKIDSDAPFAPKVFSVHKNALGLNEEKRLLFAENVTLPEFKKILQEKTGLIL